MRPHIAMLLALVFRGVALEFRWRDPAHQAFRDRAFTGGSFVAAMAQGIVLGALLESVKVSGRAYAGGWWDWLTPSSLLTGVSVTLAYGLLGATWLNLKTEGALQKQAVRLAWWLGATTLAAIGLVSLAMASLSSRAASNWLMLVGDPADPAANHIEFDPASLARVNGIPLIAIRVSRASPRTSKEGIVFRSFESAVAVDCKQANARFLHASFYAEPDFKGQPFRTVIFGPADLRSMVFRKIQGVPTQRVVRAACRYSAIKSLE